MKARAAEGLDPSGTLADNAALVVRVRVGELADLAREAEGGDPVALHDMRIAAKRLRYVLEITAPVFGETAVDGARRAKALQEVLGELHDCDVLAPRVAALIEEAGEADTAGLQALHADLLARRAVAFGDTRALWEQWTADGLGERLEAAIEEPEAL